MAKKAARKKQYWLFKSEPKAYSIDDLAAEKIRPHFGMVSEITRHVTC